MISLALCVLAVGRALYAQWVDFPAYERATERQQISSVETIATRGRIFDRHGNVLAVSNRAFIMRLNVAAITTTVDAARLAEAIAPVMQENPGVLRNRIDDIMQKRRGNYIALGVLPEVMTRTITAIEDYDQHTTDRKLTKGAVEFEEHWTRSYPFGSVAGPTVGFVTYLGDSRSGVEAFANAALAETPGKRLGRTRIDLIDSKPTLSGADVILSLDIDLQAYTEQRLSAAIKDTGAQSGLVMVMETHTGRMLSAASWPGYDPNHISELASDPAHAALLKDSAASDVYEPGSVMKLCTIAAALDAGAIQPNQLWEDSGKIVVEGRSIRNSDRRAHGTVDLTKTLAKSLNVVTVQIAQALGPDQFYRGMAAFGIGQRTGIDVGGEAAGIMRTPTNDPTWGRIDLATNSYGQGVAVTAYQMLNAINAIGNDGMLLQPFVIQQWNDAQGNPTIKKTVPLRRAISADTARIMRSIMKDATMSATPKVAPQGYTVAGKTGTADWYLRGVKQESTIVTYVGMLPADNPRLTILIKLDQPTSSPWANETTISVFHDIAARAVRLLGVPPDTQ
ncbi:MAG: penicillin-binding protein 2 [Chloroflexi bacterium]|nr:penicillin-binding protein 2 [Chloroflexota bacterium]